MAETMREGSLLRRISATRRLSVAESLSVSLEEKDQNFTQAIVRSVEISSLYITRSPRMSVPMRWRNSAHFRDSLKSASTAASDDEISSRSSARLHSSIHAHPNVGPTIQENLESTADDFLQPDCLANGDFEWTPSTLPQSVFNTSNLFLDVGLLSLPYAMTMCGWIGIPIILFFALLSSYTAKLLGRIMDIEPVTKLREGSAPYLITGYHDIGFVAFGEAGRLAVSGIVILETFGSCCVYIVLQSQNMQHLLAVHPAVYGRFVGWTDQGFMLLSALIFLPTVMAKNLSWLSYLSAVGVFSSVLLLSGVALTGFFPEIFPSAGTYCSESSDCTGSLLRPSPTIPVKWSGVVPSAALFIVGFSGHAVLPTIRNDMDDPSMYGRMVDITFSIVGTFNILLAAIGYLMFGTAAQEEITLNLGMSLVAQGVILIVIVNPLTKFALDMSPLALGLERCVMLALSVSNEGLLPQVISILSRTFLVTMALCTVIFMPDFAELLGFVGSVCSFSVAVTLPCSCALMVLWDEMPLWERLVNVSGTALGLVCTVLCTAQVLVTGK